MLAPKGAGAAAVADLWWLLFWMATAVFLFVVGFMLLAFFRRRQDEVDDDVAFRRGDRIVLWAGIIGPALILLVVFSATLWTLHIMRTPPVREDLVIHVVGRRWWWEVQYPAQGFTTANEIHIPAGQPVQLVLTSPNVIHSFWVPELQGKMDLIPGQVNTLWLEADAPGVYRGECAEFCGVQHAKMNFLVIAETAEDFDAWVARQRAPAATPDDSLARAGQEVFLRVGCMECHTVRGTTATGNLGPDLTHMASRRTLASASLDNNLGNLGGWVTDPQHVKPGSLMPPVDLTGPELQALLAYLATLE